jgi:hypothetical protein
MSHKTTRCQYPHKMDDKEFKSRLKTKAILDISELRDIAESTSGKILAGDLETNGLIPFEHHIVGFAFATDPYTGYYVPLRHLRPPNLDPDEAIPLIAKMHENNIFLYYHWMFDGRMWIAEGCSAGDWRIYDVLMMVYNADTNIQKNNLKWACLEGHTNISTNFGDIEISQVEASFSSFKDKFKINLGDKQYAIRQAAKTGVKECVKVTFSNGVEEVCSYDHRFLCKADPYEWVEAKDLSGREVVFNDDVTSMGSIDRVTFMEWLFGEKGSPLQ